MLRYKYYDTPEGQDLVKKLFVTGKYATIVGLGYSSADVILYSKPKGYLGAIARCGTITGPLLGLAVSFTTGTYIATNYRGKDDVYNYIIGSTCSGAFWGALRRSFLAGIVASLAFTAVGVLKKDSIDCNYEIFPEPRRRVDGTLWMQRHDWTIMKDPPRTWTTGENTQP